MPAIKLVAFDFGHTLKNEELHRDVPIEVQPIALMPGVQSALPQIGLPFALWANTRTAGERQVREWLRRAGLSDLFVSVVTSVDAGARKPASAFFAYALERSSLAAGDVLFVGNQRNTDIAGGEACGIRTVWLSGEAYRSRDDAETDVTPSYTIRTLDDLPDLIRRIEFS